MIIPDRFVMRIPLLFMAFLFLIACEKEEDWSTVTFTGSVRFLSTNSVAPGVPLELILIDNDIPFDRGNPGNNIVRKDSMTTTGQGVYSHSIPAGELPKNASYFIRLKAGNLLHIDTDAIFPCLADCLIFDKVDRSREINDILVDHPTFFR